MKYYKDSKEFPLFNYIRIVDTKDFFYVIKGYDGEAIEGADIKECEEKFNEIVKDFVSETNNYNKKVTMLSKIEKMKIQIINLSLLTDFLSLIDSRYYIIGKNKKYGATNLNGKIVLKPKFGFEQVKEKMLQK